MTSVVVDTNTLVSGFGWSGPPATVVDLVLHGELLLVISPPLQAELERVLAYPKLARVFPDPEVTAALVRSVADVVDPKSVLAVVADEPDNRVLEAAIEGRVDAIITGDGGLLALNSFRDIPIVSPADFLRSCA